MSGAEPAGLPGLSAPLRVTPIPGIP